MSAEAFTVLFASPLSTMFPQLKKLTLK
ncbi:unnamed protein product, partial [Rotaria sp. Silwood1]